MSFKKNGLRTLRNLLYRHYRKTGKQFRKVNRSFLRTVATTSDPFKKATTITDRHSSDDWKTLQPVWVLSTGRTGTNTLTELLKLAPSIDAFHEPAPELFQFSYDYYTGNIGRSEALNALQYLRDELVFRSFRDGFSYVETNNRVTYISDLLYELYPRSKFIFIHRNPYKFIRSGMRRGYYDDHMRDSARIKPQSQNEYHIQWENLSPIEKIAWNWVTVNEFCLNFLQGLPDTQKMGFSSDSFFNTEPSLINNLFNFIGSEGYRPPASDVRRVMGKKHNAQKKGSFATSKNWNTEQVEKVNRIIANVAEQLSYTLITKKND